MIPDLKMAMAAVIGVLSLSLGVTGWLYNGALKEKARVQGEYEAFKNEVQRLGDEAENRRLAELNRQRIVHDKSIQSLEKRLRDARARADELCKSAGLSAGCRSLPPIPSTTRPTDDAGFNERLLEVLRHAQAVADQLAELQAWVSSNAPPPHQ